MTVDYNDDIQIQLEIGFGSNPIVAVNDTIYTDVTSRLKRWNMKRGKQHELDKFEAGTGRFLLDNTDGALDPANPNSPFFPNVKIDRRIRFTTIVKSVPLPIFRVYNGFIKSYRQIYPTKNPAPKGFSEVFIEAVDGFQTLAETELPDSVWEFEIRDTIAGIANAQNQSVLWYRLGDSDDTDVAKNDGNFGTSPGNPSPAAANGVYRGANKGQSSLVFLSPNSSVQFTQRTAPEISDKIEIANRIFSYPFTIEFFMQVAGDGTLGSEPNIAIMVGGSPGSGDVFTTTPNSQTCFLDSLGKIVFNIVDGANSRRTASNRALDDGQIHHIAWKIASATSHRVFIDGSEDTVATTTTGTGAPVLNSTGLNWRIGPSFQTSAPVAPYQIDEVIQWANNALSDADILAHAEAGIDTASGFRRTVAWGEDFANNRFAKVLDFAKWPSVDRFIDPGGQELQPVALDTNALEFLQKEEETEFGAFFVDKAGRMKFLDKNTLFTDTDNTVPQHTYGDAPAETGYIEIAEPIFDDVQIRNDIRIGRDRGPASHVEDATSIDEHYRKKFNRTDLRHFSELYSDDYADFIALNFGQPTERIDSITIDIDQPNLDVINAVFKLELMDKVRLFRRPPSGQVKTIDANILAIEHDSSASPRRWSVTFQLTNLGELINTFWLIGIVGRSEIGQTTVLGF